MSTARARGLAGLTLVTAGGAVSGVPVLTVPAGLLLGFVLPGLFLTELLFDRRTPVDDGPARRGRALGAVERIVLVPALSLAVLVTAGLVIHLTGLPLNRLSWAVATAATALGALLAGAVLERRAYAAAATDRLVERQAELARARVLEAEQRSAAQRDVEPDAARAAPVEVRTGAELLAGQQALLAAERVRAADLRTERNRRRRRMLLEFAPLVLVVAVLAGAGVLSVRSATDHYAVTVTALSATPPGPADATGARVVAVSASGLVAADGPYTLRATGATGPVGPSSTIAVPAGGTWTGSLAVPATERVTVALYRATDTAPYRTVVIAATS